MPIALYTDAARVAASLRLVPDTTLVAVCVAGAGTISVASVTSAGGVALYPGMSLALDQYNPGLREVVQINGQVTGTGPYTVPITPTLYAHGQGAPVKEVSAIGDVIGAASRMVDDATFTVAGAFAQQSWTETVEGQATTDGRIFALVSGRGVSAVSSFTWQGSPTDAAITIQAPSITWDDYRIYGWPGGAPVTSTGSWAGTTPYPHYKSLYVTVSYTAGYSPIPDDLARSATVLAARLFKEGDTGFSDVLANQDLGILQYKKGIPRDVEVLLRPWKRWT